MTASVYAYCNGTANAAYAMSKAGIEQFGRALRTELAPHGATAGPRPKMFRWVVEL